MYRAAIITLSDKGARGEREDVSGQMIADMLAQAGYEVGQRLLPATTGRGSPTHSSASATGARRS